MKDTPMIAPRSKNPEEGLGLYDDSALESYIWRGCDWPEAEFVCFLKEQMGLAAAGANKRQRHLLPETATLGGRRWDVREVVDAFVKRLLVAIAENDRQPFERISDLLERMEAVGYRTKRITDPSEPMPFPSLNEKERRMNALSQYVLRHEKGDLSHFQTKAILAYYKSHNIPATEKTVRNDLKEMGLGTVHTHFVKRKTKRKIVRQGPSLKAIKKMVENAHAAWDARNRKR